MFLFTFSCPVPTVNSDPWPDPWRAKQRLPHFHDRMFEDTVRCYHIFPTIGTEKWNKIKFSSDQTWFNSFYTNSVKRRYWVTPSQELTGDLRGTLHGLANRFKNKTPNFLNHIDKPEIAKALFWGYSLVSRFNFLFHKQFKGCSFTQVFLFSRRLWQLDFLPSWISTTGWIPISTASEKPAWR